MLYSIRFVYHTKTKSERPVTYKKQSHRVQDQDQDQSCGLKTTVDMKIFITSHQSTEKCYQLSVARNEQKKTKANVSSKMHSTHSPNRIHR